jgi:hypothetical protein
METQLVTRLPAEAAARSARAHAVALLGPLTAAAGVVWAIAQPDRLTLLHPRGERFWWLVAEPPLYVIAVGVLFRMLLAPGIVEDLEASK